MQQFVRSAKVVQQPSVGARVEVGDMYGRVRDRRYIARNCNTGRFGTVIRIVPDSPEPMVQVKLDPVAIGGASREWFWSSELDVID